MGGYNTNKLSIPTLAMLAIIGLAGCYVPYTVTAVWVLVFFITIVASVSNRQEWIWYCIAASPILEVWSRMVKGAVMVDEVGKYYILFAIGTIIIYHVKEQSEKPLHHAGTLICVFLLPGLFVNLVDFDREQWVFNILPTVELAVLLILVARERWDIERFARTLQFGLMPIVFVAIYLALKTPAVSTVHFNLRANFKASGGGTNQVSTILGLGIVYTMLLLLLKRPFMAKWACYLLIAFLFFRSFLTFSRGGVFSAVVSVFAAIGFAMMVNKRTFIRYTIIMVLFTISGVLVFNKVDEMTGHMLSDRYRGETIATKSGELEKTWNKVTSGRTSLVMADWYIFKNNVLFGVGPGGAKNLRSNYGGPPDSAAHTEYTRLLSEHGIGGLMAALVLLLFPLYWINKQKYRLWMGVSAALFCLAIMSASHSANRTNTTIVCYVLAAVPVYVTTKKRGGQ